MHPVEIRIKLNEGVAERLTEIFERIEEVARTHRGRPQPAVLAALEQIYIDLDYGSTEGLDLPEVAQRISDGEDQSH